MNLSRLTPKDVILLLVAAALIFYSVFHLTVIGAFLMRLIQLIMPFLIGSVAAFILNVPLRGFERRLQGRFQGRSGRLRVVSIVLSIFTVLVVFVAVGVIVLPQLVQSVTLLVKNTPTYIDQLEALAASIPDSTGKIAETLTMLEGLSAADIQEKLLDFLMSGVLDDSAIGDVISSTMGIFSSIASIAVNTIIGLIFSIYVLMSKEKLAAQARKICFAYLSGDHARSLIHVCQVTFDKFYHFVTGQLTEAVILGTLCTVGMLILRLPYAPMIGVLTGFCALIPIVGAFIGGAVGALLIVTVSPTKALIFLIFLVVLQQLEGHVIYPHVVGGSVGLPSMWTLFAITVGGSVMGLVGMLIAVPTCAAFYFLFSEAVHGRLKQRDIDEDNPVILNGLDDGTRKS